MSHESMDPGGTTEAWQAFVNRTEAPTQERRANTGLWIVAIVVAVVAIGALFFVLATG
jgi:hypothetical protein